MDKLFSALWKKLNEDDAFVINLAQGARIITIKEGTSETKYIVMSTRFKEGLLEEKPTRIGIELNKENQPVQLHLAYNSHDLWEGSNRKYNWDRQFPIALKKRFTPEIIQLMLAGKL